MNGYRSSQEGGTMENAITKENYIMLKETHFPYGRYIFQKTDGEAYATSTPSVVDKKLNAPLDDANGMRILNSIMDAQRLPEHKGMNLFTIYNADSQVVAVFTIPPGFRLIGQQYYAVVVDGVEHFRLKDSSGHGNYTICSADTKIADVELMEKHLRRSSHLVKVEGTVDLPLLLESLVLADIYSHMQANMMMDALV